MRLFLFIVLGVVPLVAGDIFGTAPERVVHYTSDGLLQRPSDFGRWVFVGSNLGLGYSNSASAMTDKESARPLLEHYHNIYIDPDSYDAYVKTGLFPDKTMLVMDVYDAGEKEPRGIVEKGSFNGSHAGIEVAVKDRERPDGQATEWAYYDFSGTGTPSGFDHTSKAMPDRACYACHKAHASDDNVWVQFYPMLRKIKQPE